MRRFYCMRKESTNNYTVIYRSIDTGHYDVIYSGVYIACLSVLHKLRRREVL
jgi:hypothetical protein